MLLLTAALITAFPAGAVAQTRDVEERVGASVTDSGSITFSTGLDFSTGHYGEAQRTDILVAPLVLRLAATDWLSVSASSAYVRISGANVVLGPDGEPLPGFPVANTTRQGIGDLALGATLSIPTGESPWLIDVTMRTKLPTAARSRGISTGKADFSAGIDISYLVGKIAPFAALDYRIAGDPAGFNLRNTISTSVGATIITGKKAVILSYDYEQAISAFSKDGHSLFAAYSAPVAKGLNLTLYGSAGLSSGSAAFESGLLLSLRLD